MLLHSLRILPCYQRKSIFLPIPHATFEEVEIPESSLVELISSLEGHGVAIWVAIKVFTTCLRHKWRSHRVHQLHHWRHIHLGKILIRYIEFATTVASDNDGFVLRKSLLCHCGEVRIALSGCHCQSAGHSAFDVAHHSMTLDFLEEWHIDRILDPELPEFELWPYIYEHSAFVLYHLLRLNRCQ